MFCEPFFFSIILYYELIDNKSPDSDWTFYEVHGQYIVLIDSTTAPEN